MRLLPIEAGLVIVAGTHIWLLNQAMPPDIQRYHAAINLLGAGLIAYGVFY